MLAARAATPAAQSCHPGLQAAMTPVRTFASISHSLPIPSPQRLPARFEAQSRVASVSGVRARRAGGLRIRAMADKPDDNSSGNPSTESQFMRELRRRREAQSSNSQSDAASKAPGAGAGGSAAGGGGEGGAGMRDQRAVSNALNSEGLEGLPARAKELIKLGLSFYLPLWPFALAIIIAFTATYLFLGSDFVHPGKSYGEGRQPPSYIDPYALLEEEEKYMERIPYDMSTYLKDNYDPELDG
ncbi:unnamed protein product [Closterium sp. Naga37s-1]|nr:unnamed protein product [Closterium sp. Naga37s-1]